LIIPLTPSSFALDQEIRNKIPHLTNNIFNRGNVPAFGFT
jgi:hypothetical protein